MSDAVPSRELRIETVTREWEGDVVDDLNVFACMEAHNLSEYERVAALDDDLQSRERFRIYAEPEVDEGGEWRFQTKETEKSVYKNGTFACRGRLWTPFGGNGLEVVVDDYRLSFTIAPEFEKRLRFDGSHQDSYEDSDKRYAYGRIS
ncbi:MAG: hypothetical protein ACTTKL_10045 [Treponema sp.]